MLKEENKEKTQKQKHTMKRVLQDIGHYRWMVLLSLLLAGITVALTLYIPILIGKAVDLVLAQGLVNFTGLAVILKHMIITILLTALAQWLMNVINNHITYRVVKDMRIRAFEKIQKLPLKYVDSHQYGEVLSRVITDVDQFSDGLLMGFTQLFSGLLTIAGTLLFMFSINPVIAAIVVVLTPVSLFVAGFIAKKTFYMFKAQSEARGDMTSLVNEILENEKVVQAFGYEEEASRRFGIINDKLADCSLKAIFFSSITNPATRFVNGIVYASVGVAGAYAAIRGVLTVGQLTSFLNYANQYTKPFNEISGVATEFQNALASAARVFELIDEEPTVTDAEGAAAPGQVEGNVSMEHVYFSYNPEVRLIEDLNLTVKPGERIAIVGPTGCGKSTVINLLMRFYDVDQGTIRVDGTDIRNMTRESLRAGYGMVLQETWLKSASIRENIAYGKPDAAEEEIIEAARKRMPTALLCVCRRAMIRLSQKTAATCRRGRNQLLCIARVMLCLPPMLILDEATSSIDTRTEIMIQEAFARMMEGRTSFIVAHRLSTIREADTILVMKNGRIIEQGSHEELLAQKGFYSELYNSQFAVS